MAQYRYQAVREVLGGSPIGEVAARHGTSRQSVHTWRRRFESEGMPGLADRSRRPKTSPNRLPAEVEALICQLRQQHPRWGARRISHELAVCGTLPAASRATVHRVLTRNGLINAQEQVHKRKYKRWQRAQPMHLWQLDLVGGVFLADGRECKMLTGIDDHSRFVVVSTLLVVPSGRAVCEAFSAAMRQHGVPSEVLTDNGKQFTGRFTKPMPAEVMFEKVCRQNGITTRLTKPYSPTTTGKIERFHKTLREEFLNQAAPFESLTAAQEAVDGWVYAYNHSRPHQALDMATPASRFRPNGPVAPPSAAAHNIPGESDKDSDTAAESSAVDMLEVAPPPPVTTGAVQFEVLVPPSGAMSLASTGQTIEISKAWAGRTVTIWADLRSIHVSVDGQHVRTFRSRLNDDHIRWLRMRGARAAGPAPAAAAIAQVNGQPHLPRGQAVEIERNVRRDGFIIVGKQSFLVGRDRASRRITLRLDGHLMHAVCDGALIATWPCPISASNLGSLRSARVADTPVPPPPLPAGSLHVQRRVGNHGRIMVGNQRMKVGKAHFGKIVTVAIEDTCFRIRHGEEELAVRPRKNTAPITKVKVYARHSRHTPDPSSIS